MEVALDEVAILSIPKFTASVNADATGSGSRLAVNVFWSTLKNKKFGARNLVQIIEQHIIACKNALPVAVQA